MFLDFIVFPKFETARFPMAFFQVPQKRQHPSPKLPERSLLLLAKTRLGYHHSFRRHQNKR